VDIRSEPTRVNTQSPVNFVRMGQAAKLREMTCRLVHQRTIGLLNLSTEFHLIISNFAYMSGTDRKVISGEDNLSTSQSSKSCFESVHDIPSRAYSAYPEHCLTARSLLVLLSRAQAVSTSQCRSRCQPLGSFQDQAIALHALSPIACPCQM
jgi:hypothetical protein